MTLIAGRLDVPRFVLGADYDVRLLGPTNTRTGAVVTDSPTPIGVKLRVFDERKCTNLSAAEVTNQTVLSVTRPDLFVVGVDRMIVLLDNFTYHDAGILTARDVDAGTITVPTQLPSPAAAGRPVYVGVGNAVGVGGSWETDMVYFNAGASTEVAGNFDYGWRQVIIDNHADLTVGMTLAIQVDLHSAANNRGVFWGRTYVEG